jgi:serralysin
LRGQWRRCAGRRLRQHREPDGSNFADVLIGDAGANQLVGSGGDDNLTGGLGADTLIGGAGFDLARYDNATAGVAVRLDMPAANTGEAAGDIFIQIEGLVGSGFSDTLVGDGDANYLFGLGGNDVLVGFGGADALLGNDGDDSLYGGAGADQLDGGEGFDFARYDDQGFVQASLDPGFGNAGAAAGDSFFNIEGLVAAPLATTFSAMAARTSFTALEGATFCSGAPEPTSSTAAREPTSPATSTLRRG